jgi:hypothetical protein
VTPEELDVAAAPSAFPEADHDNNDTKTNQDDPRNEKRSSAWQEDREQCRAHERNGCHDEGFHKRKVVRRAVSRVRERALA